MKWTEEEKQKLVASVAKNTKNNRIQWLKVQNDVGKSANLCKSMYIIQLNLKQFTATQKWTFEQTLQLFALTSIYGKEWQFLQKTYFPNRTSGQLRQKYLHAKQKAQYQMQITRELMEHDVNDCQEELIQILETLKSQLNARREVDNQILMVAEGKTSVIPDLALTQYLIQHQKEEEKKCQYQYSLEDCIQKIEKKLGI